ncbi:MAG: hypothetical protein GFH27_549283n388 [Chloroflexi bacterium AL-W]|nr:hypothetical protein [Chloroflexi bacterium AL-N1]NOK64490.1 hypothetical protein [Chloroflexi bacterium AL-N10]NOK75732.1 hypothetical protein [Chloroflexi bacterium AL-N5]NOK80509.1 hypothetical protein [Chloroflexi bacterium AL-W]NOK87023.1 hypothetical protein [Chloroflexi bacterium AL-N15]
MKKTAFLGTLIAGIMILVLMVVPGASASSGFAPSFQDETPTAEEEATEEVVEETTPEATEEVVEETTSETTDDTTTDDTPAALPETGGNSGLSTLLLGFAALIIMGIAAAMIASSRRRTQI